MEIISKLSEVQAALKAPKSQFNSFGKYKYRSVEDILEALKPHLRAQGTAITLEDCVEEVAGRHYIKATASFWSGQDKVSASAYAREQADKKGMDQAQITGAASSYARKYALGGLFALDDNRDPDAQKPAPPKQTAPEPDPAEPMITKAQQQELVFLTNALRLEPAQALASINGWLTKNGHPEVKKSAELTQDQAAQLIEAMNQSVAKQREKAAKSKMDQMPDSYNNGGNQK